MVILYRQGLKLVKGQLNDGLEQIRLVIGGEETTGLSDQSIKDALWEYYFDAEKTVEWALGEFTVAKKCFILSNATTEEQQRRQLARERKGERWV